MIEKNLPVTINVYVTILNSNETQNDKKELKL